MEQTETTKKILIIDDDRFLLDMYAVKFRERGFEVIEAFGSTEALTKVKAGAVPDIMLLDVVMPAMNGFELLAIIKEENLIPETKIIMLSNLGQPEDIEKGKSIGANGYIIKATATPSEIVEKVLLVLGGENSFANVE